jgi:hypothetical protein
VLAHPLPPRRPSRWSGHCRGGALSRWLLVSLALSSGALSGCSLTWDDITSRDYHFKDAFKKPPDPMWVIQNSPDGDKKAAAFRSLKEPLQNGGTQEEQDVVVRLLVWTAANDPQAVCRMGAIDALRRFHDPRAVQGLVEAYYHANGLAEGVSSRTVHTDPTQQGFPQDTASVIRTVALTALGDVATVQDARGQAAAVKVLVDALVTAGPEKNVGEQLQTLDERLAAARGLGHYPQYQSAEALVKVLHTTPDVALRNGARDSLVKITGKDLPPDAGAWDDFLHKPPAQEAVAGTGNVFDQFIRRISGTTENSQSPK